MATIASGARTKRVWRAGVRLPWVRNDGGATGGGLGLYLRLFPRRSHLPAMFLAVLRRSHARSRTVGTSNPRTALMMPQKSCSVDRGSLGPTQCVGVPLKNDHGQRKEMRRRPGLGHRLVTNADVVVGREVPRIMSCRPLNRTRGCRKRSVPTSQVWPSAN